jgi:replication-associated recombination protein RarA
MKSKGGLGGKAFFLSGPSGTGKTSCAFLIAQEVCDEGNIIELDASGLTPAAIQEIERSMQYRSIGVKAGRAVVVNECHALRKDTIRQLLVTLERIPRHCVWVFTTTHTGKKQLFDGIDAQPLLSRCVQFEFHGLMQDREKGKTDGSPAMAFAMKAKEIAAAEGLDGRPLLDYLCLANECRCNMREMLTRIESGAMLCK